MASKMDMIIPVTATKDSKTKTNIGEEIMPTGTTNMQTIHRRIVMIRILQVRPRVMDKQMMMALDLKILRVRLLKTTTGHRQRSQ